MGVSLRGGERRSGRVRGRKKVLLILLGGSSSVLELVYY